MSYRCSKCDVTWWPFEARDGVCPRCGGGTRGVQETGDSGRLQVKDATARESERQLAELEELGALPPVEPDRPRSCCYAR